MVIERGEREVVCGDREEGEREVVCGDREGGERGGVW